MAIGMSDELTSFDQHAVIKVCGVGGGGGNAVTRMIEEGLEEVEFIAINTDAQALKRSPASNRLQIGVSITGGLGSGAQPEIGQKAALEDKDRIAEAVQGADMVFVTTGLGGGTGTGAAPVVAEAARASGALTVGIATLPFGFEGEERMENALKGLEQLEQFVDTMIVIPNDRVARLCQDNMSLLEAFRRADEVLHNGVRAISDLITIPGLINLDFADVRTIMQSRGRALMGIGIAEGEDRATRAAREAIISPLLEQSSIEGARGVIANVKGGCDVGMREVQEAVSTVQSAAHASANIIFGAVVGDEARTDIQVTVIAAGFPAEARNEPAGISVVSSAKEPAPPREAGREESLATVTGNSDNDGSSSPQEQSTHVEYLFPEEPAEQARPLAKVEPDDDLSIPAFMRKRRSKP